MVHSTEATLLTQVESLRHNAHTDKNQRIFAKAETLTYLILSYILGSVFCFSIRKASQETSLYYRYTKQIDVSRDVIISLSKAIVEGYLRFLKELWYSIRCIHTVWVSIFSEPLLSHRTGFSRQLSLHSLFPCVFIVLFLLLFYVDRVVVTVVCVKRKSLKYSP